MRRRNPGRTTVRSAALAALAALAACAQPPEPPPAAPPPADAAAFVGGMYVFRCEGDYRFSARVDRDSVVLRLGTRTLTLPQVVAASGTRYFAEGVTFWSRGLEALLETPSAAYRQCVGQRAETPWAAARLLGYDFRAVGQEPGWFLDVDDDGRTHLATDYGREHVEVPTPRPAVDAASGTTTYHARTDAHDLRVVISETPCQDTMSGEDFPTAVTVLLDGREYRGCGRPLAGAAGAPRRP